MERWHFTTTFRGTKMDFYNAFFKELDIHQIFEGFVYVAFIAFNGHCLTSHIIKWY